MGFVSKYTYTSLPRRVDRGWRATASGEFEVRTGCRRGGEPAQGGELVRRVDPVRRSRLSDVKRARWSRAFNTRVRRLA